MISEPVPSILFALTLSVVLVMHIAMIVMVLEENKKAIALPAFITFLMISTVVSANKLYMEYFG